MMKNPNKNLYRTTLLGVSFATVLCMAAPATAGMFDGVKLKVGTWGGSWKENMEEIIVPKFEAEGGEIEFVTGSPAANFAKIIAARGQSPFDLMEILDAQVAHFHELGYLQPLNLELIPNKSKIADFQQNEWLVGSWDSQEAICYHKDKFKDLGIPVPTTYSDLVHPEIAGRISFPDINSGGGLANLGGVVYAAGGDEINIQPGLQLIDELQVLKFWSRGGETLAQFESGDIIAAVGNAGWCLRTKRAGVNVASVHPRIKDDIVGVAKVGWLGVMKDSQNVEAAHWFINQYLADDFQVLFATKSGLVPINRDAIAKMAEDPRVAEMLMLDPAEISKQLRIDYSKVTISDWTDQWNRSVVK